MHAQDRGSRIEVKTKVWWNRGRFLLFIIFRNIKRMSKFITCIYAEVFCWFQCIQANGARVTCGPRGGSVNVGGSQCHSSHTSHWYKQLHARCRKLFISTKLTRAKIILKLSENISIDWANGECKIVNSWHASPGEDQKLSNFWSYESNPLHWGAHYRPRVYLESKIETWWEKICIWLDTIRTETFKTIQFYNEFEDIISINYDQTYFMQILTKWMCWLPIVPPECRWECFFIVKTSELSLNTGNTNPHKFGKRDRAISDFGHHIRRNIVLLWNKMHSVG